jgi:hypothetical protein
MVTRQEAVLSFVKFNKFAKQLIYDICIGGNTKLTTYADELLHFEQWKEDIMLYTSLNPDPIIIDKIAMLGSPEMLENYIKDGKETLPKNTYDALSGVVQAMKSIHALCFDLNQESKGKFKYLVNEFAYEEAADLFDRAVSAGYLTAEYQPKGDTDLYTLKILAFAIGEMLHLTMRHKWSHFEEQWNIDKSNKLSSLPVTEKQFKRNEKVMRLYPEVDFSELTQPNERDILMQSMVHDVSVVYIKTFTTRANISQDTTVDAFLSIFNLGEQTTRKPIEWIKSQRHLSYFIFFAFSKTNKDYGRKQKLVSALTDRLPIEEVLLQDLPH